MSATYGTRGSFFGLRFFGRHDALFSTNIAIKRAMSRDSRGWISTPIGVIFQTHGFSVKNFAEVADFYQLKVSHMSVVNDEWQLVNDEWQLVNLSMTNDNNKSCSFSKIVYTKNFGKKCFRKYLRKFKTFKHVEFCEVVKVLMLVLDTSSFQSSYKLCRQRAPLRNQTALSRPLSAYWNTPSGRWYWVTCSIIPLNLTFTILCRKSRLRLSLSDILYLSALYFIYFVSGQTLATNKKQFVTANICLVYKYTVLQLHCR